MAVNRILFNNIGNLVLVQCIGRDAVEFISDLKANLDEFKLGSYDSSSSTITFTCKAINHSSDNRVEYICNYQIYLSYKVLIKNRRIVSTDVSSLVINNLMDLK